MTLGQRIRLLREERGWRREDLASRSRVGYATLERIELRGGGCRVDNLIRIADALNLSIDELLGRRPPRDQDGGTPAVPERPEPEPPTSGGKRKPTTPRRRTTAQGGRTAYNSPSPRYVNPAAAA